MEVLNLTKPLPSCRVTKRLLAQLENHLLNQIPKLLKNELSRMMALLDLKNPGALRTYSISIQDAGGLKEFQSISEHREEFLPRSVTAITMDLKLGRPEILRLSIAFTRNQVPLVHLGTASQAVKPYCEKILLQIRTIVDNWANRFWIFHHPASRGFVTLAIPAAAVGYGHLTGADRFFLYASLGWLLLLSALLGFSLSRAFPLISFQTRKHLQFRRLLHFLLLVFTLGAIAAYIAILFLELNLVRH